MERHLLRGRARRAAGFVFGSLLALSAGATLPQGQPSPGPGTPPAAAGQVTLAQCRVKLINDVQLASARGGILARVAAEGSRIAAGQPVAELREELARIGLQIAEQEASSDVEIRFAEKSSEFARLKYLRALDANQRAAGTVSELELQELRLEAERALLQLEQARQKHLVAQLRCDETRELLGTCRVLAPFEATVVQVYKHPGEVVREGEPIAEVVNTERVRIEGQIPLAESVRIQAGARVEVVVADPEAAPALRAQRFAGEIGFVDVKVEPVSRTIRVWAWAENRGGLLRDGMTVTMTITPR